MKNIIAGVAVLTFIAALSVLIITTLAKSADEAHFVEIHGEPEADGFHWKEDKL